MEALQKDRAYLNSINAAPHWRQNFGMLVDNSRAAGGLPALPSNITRELSPLPSNITRERLPLPSNITRERSPPSLLLPWGSIHATHAHTHHLRGVYWSRPKVVLEWTTAASTLLFVRVVVLRFIYFCDDHKNNLGAKLGNLFCDRPQTTKNNQT